MIRKASAGDVSELVWFKSSYSDGPDGNSCVEIAIAPRTVHVRDSKTPAGPRLALTPAAWTRFLTYAADR
ncbi:DUF397 domain-containing protein [Streptomyces cellulosae]|jgi:hypothetical protein|uniref:DUF397 domain-containing protein n=2 Tax=Streptomyces TaxID=1883 RepID=A0ABU3J3F3_9ACTN|nr:DUF397 domain-containing protein [Streptomyces sp. McG7]MBT2903789.1 DUF397 domain-containing protein [Streptomyces sp. McG8]MDQ0488135.1 hypothetical protein [Streptomyces thermodiastaticus]MDT6969605.1 DUF397 domain-containing protein [Streptomyces thermocarboxydus]MYQ29773.1 DUF397 domain-containing protein [Streptomyces sp. SID4956]MYW53492.1 DUF397 domain-containing protein [Streptomyces sp. SID8376]WSB43004.1 DUF397 domain-containing protein [Streptomyces cellulosae]